MKKIKKIAASIMAMAAMSTSIVGIKASALTDSYSLQRTAGAPSSSNVTIKDWNFNAAYNKTTMTGYTSFAYSVCELYLYSTTGIDCYFRQNTSGSVSADATVGVSVYAKAELLHYNSGTNSASGSITG